MSTNTVFPKKCKVFPRNDLQYISGILPKQKRIDVPSEVTLNAKELRRCMSYATVYEVVEKGDVLLTPENYLADNADAKLATDVPDVELAKPQEEVVTEEGEDTPPVEDPVEDPVENPSEDPGSDVEPPVEDDTEGTPVEPETDENGIG